MEKLQGFTDHVMLYVKTLVKWLLAAALIGTVGGAVGSLFHLGVEYATGLRMEVPALLYALPLAGVLICQSFSFTQSSSPRSSRIWRAAARDVRARRCRSAATSASTSARCCAWTIRTVAWRRCAA